jgi:hypothetical protein
VSDVIKNARNKIAQAEANIPQAKVKFEAEPLKDQVNKTQGRLDVRSTETLRNVWHFVKRQPSRALAQLTF